MSRVSLNRRLDALRSAAERIDPRVLAVHRLPPALRMSYDNWRRECDRVYADLEREGGPGASYEALIEGTLALPEPPRPVADALGITRGPVVPAGASDSEVAEIYRAMIDD